MHALKNGLVFGSILYLIGLCLPAPGYAVGPAKGAYSVAKGDCLWAIAARKDVFGDPWKWPLLFEANRGRINDPDFIQPGWRLKVPLAPSAAQVARAKAYARAYGETVVTEAQAEAAPAAAPPVEAPPAPVADPGSGPPKTWALAAVVSLVCLILGLVMFVGVMAYRWLQDRDMEDTRPAEAPVAPAAPGTSAGASQAPDAPPAPAAPEALAVAPQAPAVTADPANAAPAQAVAPESPAPQGPVPSTESEANLRADGSPDPMHPEDHRHAA